MFITDIYVCILLAIITYINPFNIHAVVSIFQLASDGFESKDLLVE